MVPPKNKPLLLASLIVVLLFLTTSGPQAYFKSFSTDSLTSSNVLGDEKSSEDEDKDEEKDKDEDKNKDDSEDEGKDENEEKDKNDDEDKDNEKEDDSEEVEDENEDSKTSERIINANGTISEIEREKEDGNVKMHVETYNGDGQKIEEREYESDGTKHGVKIKTYDGNGNKISENEYKGKSDKDEEEIKTKTYDSLGNDLSDLRFETKDGKEVELKIKGTSPILSKIKYDLEKQEVEIEEPEKDTASRVENKIVVKVKNDSFEIRRSGVSAFSNFPMTIDQETGRIFITTLTGEVELKAMPDVVVQKANSSNNVDLVTKIELDSPEEPGTPDAGKTQLNYRIIGRKNEKLFGLFEIPIESILNFDAVTGEFLRSDRSFDNTILDLLSI